MSSQTVMTASLMCTMGIGVSSLTVVPIHRVRAQGQPAATIADHVPLVNIAPFPLCNSIANPIVVAATAAKLGVFTPAACLPNTPVPWTPGSPTVLIGGVPALGSGSTCQCLYGGVVSVVQPVAVTVNEP
ncbi:DUF4280 domain-containing protein [Massilia sp. IC2-278]|uniref:DUF4280 domain-containing protein n=1 Tax=Massilia sp. IC2-278 TaxID=2887200 RepID=UPI001E6182A0|nr:DUF4280 domain-containing protein [Massilia sp. IC2-278]MCC2959336.1 DUF4280 domain-containing protein [Massilia sp. IC2-278]